MNATHFSRHATRRLCVAGGLGIGCLVCTSLAQTPVPEGNDAYPSRYTHPLRTWDAPTIHHGSPGKLSPPDLSPDRLQSIVIPHVEFRNTPLGDAVKYLQQEGRRLDPEPDPAKRGVSIVVQFPTPAPPVGDPVIPGLPSAWTPSPGSTLPILTNRQTPVSLSVSKLSLFETLKYVAQQVGLKIKVEPDAVYMVPADSPHLMITAEYRVPPELLGGSPDPSTPSPEDNKDESETVVNTNSWARSWLESQEVPFPPGASATYRPRTHRLIVRNTQENLDKIAALISSALKALAPTPANP